MDKSWKICVTVVGPHILDKLRHKGLKNLRHSGISDCGSHWFQTPGTASILPGYDSDTNLTKDFFVGLCLTTSAVMGIHIVLGTSSLKKHRFKESGRQMAHIFSKVPRLKKKAMQAAFQEMCKLEEKGLISTLKEDQTPEKVLPKLAFAFHCNLILHENDGPDDIAFQVKKQPCQLSYHALSSLL